MKKRQRKKNLKKVFRAMIYQSFIFSMSAELRNIRRVIVKTPKERADKYNAYMRIHNKIDSKQKIEKALKRSQKKEKCTFLHLF